jgi:putative thiamine transport system substrate-binding protein
MIAFLSRLCFALLLIVGLAMPAHATGHRPPDWQRMLDAARGKTVRMCVPPTPHVMRLIGWARDELRFRFGIELMPVLVDGPRSVLAALRAERTSGTWLGNSDLVWMGAAYLAEMEAEGLLLPTPWADRITPAARLTGMVHARADTWAEHAVPWGLAQLSFYANRLDDTPRTLEALADWAGAHPGRFTYPAPPSALGTRFLAQALLTLVDQREFLYRSAVAAEIDTRLAPLWTFLDRLHPDLWLGGSQFPDSAETLRGLFEDGGIDIAMTLNPAEASAQIAAGLLPASVRSFVLDQGSIASAHFLAIPFNAPAADAAMVVADFLLSPEAQARKADETVWGDPSVLDYDSLNAEGRALFDTLRRGVATLPERERGALLAEPHASWLSAIAQRWQQRYGMAEAGKAPGTP